MSAPVWPRHLPVWSFLNSLSRIVSGASVSLGTGHHQQSPLDHYRVSGPQLETAWRRFKRLMTYTCLHPHDDTAWLCLGHTSTLLCWLELNCLSCPTMVHFPGSPVQLTLICGFESVPIQLSAEVTNLKFVSAHNCLTFSIGKVLRGSTVILPGAAVWPQRVNVSILNNLNNQS